ncbi:MAG: hypothetical protein AB7S39_17910 [Gemmatimonadales bacterium]
MKLRLLGVILSGAALAACSSQETVAGPDNNGVSPIVFPGGENSPPTVEISSPTDGQLFAFTSSAGAPVNLVATLADPDPADTHTCSIDWEGATSDGVVDEADGTGTCSGSYLYSTPGVYTIAVTVTDPFGETATDSVMIVVYDPSGGFVTGGGWIDAAAGSYPANPELSGKATFGFVAKYKKGANVPDGNTEFQFHAAGMNFHSSAYDWLVVAGSRAQYKGTGSVNGVDGYQFMLTAIDGGKNSADRLRMRIWSSGGVVFDNQLGDDENADPSTYLSGGNIVIHK